MRLPNDEDTEKTPEELKASEEHRTAWIKAEYEIMRWPKPEQIEPREQLVEVKP